MTDDEVIDWFGDATESILGTTDRNYHQVERKRALKVSSAFFDARSKVLELENELATVKSEYRVWRDRVSECNP